MKCNNLFLSNKIVEIWNIFCSLRYGFLFLVHLLMSYYYFKLADKKLYLKSIFTLNHLLFLKTMQVNWSSSSNMFK